MFLAFTLSQTGMVVHWRRRRKPGWRRSLAINALGTGLSALVLADTTITKFPEGAWVTALIIPALVLLFLRIRHHYDRVGEAIRLRRVGVSLGAQTIVPVACPPPVRAQQRPGRSEAEEAPDELAHLVVVPALSLDLATVRTLAYGASLGQPLLAVHLAPDGPEGDCFRQYWNTWGNLLPLQVIDSPYRSVVAPMTAYLEALHAQRPDVTITVLLPELVVRYRWHQPLHNQIAPRLRRALRQHPGIVISTVPFHLPT